MNPYNSVLLQIINSFLETKRLEDAQDIKMEVHVLPAGATFVFTLTEKTWQEARESCRSMGGDLATLPTYREIDFVKKFIPKAEFQTYWIGGSSPDGKDNWKWVTGERIPLNFGRWALGEPSLGGKCSVYYYGSNGKYYGIGNLTCLKKHKYVCKIEK